MNFTNIEALKKLITNNQLLNTADTNDNVQANAATETMDLSASDYSVANNAVYATGAKGETFDPNTRVTKGEVALSLYTADGSPDVNVPAGYSKVDAWAKSSGLFGDSYNSNDPITNEEMVNLLRNYAGHRGFDTQGYINLGDYYSDGTGINSNNIDAYTWAVDNQIYTGASLNPSGIVSRGDFSNMLSAFDNAYSAELGLVPINNINTNIPNITPINGNVGINTSTDVTNNVNTSTGAVQTGYNSVQTQTETVDPSTVNGVTNTSTQPTTQIPSTASTAEQTAMQNNFLQNLLNMFNGLGANNKNNTNVGGAQTATSYTQNNGASAYNGTTANIPTTSATTSKYTDVRQADMEAVNYVSDRGLMVGTSATTFNPDAGVTRAQMVQILYSMSGSPSNVGGKTSYKDVGSGEWYTNAVAWAQNTGLVGGYDDGTFRPNQVLTTEQAAAIFKKYAEQSGKNTYTIKQINNPVNYNSLGGTSDVSNYAQDAVKWAVRDGMIDTSSGSINPKKELTRAEFARYLMNYDINYNGGAGKSNYNVTAKQNPGITQTTTPTATPTKSINEIAAEVINGDWGNGDERRQRLEAAGYNYNEVQSAVNSQFTYTPSSSGGSSPSKTTSSNKYNSTDVWTRTNPNATYGPTTKTKASSNGGHYAEGTTRDNKTTKTTTSSTKSKVDTSFSTVSNVALNSATMVKKVKNTSQTISKPKADAHYISGQSAKKQKFKK